MSSPASVRFDPEVAKRLARFVAAHPGLSASAATNLLVDEALRCREEGTKRVILFNLSGHGHFDMQAYTDYLSGRLVDQDYDAGMLDQALAHEGNAGLSPAAFPGPKARCS